MKTLALLLAAAGLSGCVAYGHDPYYYDYGGGYGHGYGTGGYVVEQPTYIYGGTVTSPYHGRGYRERHDRQHHRGYRRDRDRDGIPDRVDRDRDGDGVPNWRDSRPRNPRRY